VVGPREALWCKRALLDGWSCGSCGVDRESWHGDERALVVRIRALLIARQAVCSLDDCHALNQRVMVLCNA
jgi:hypothetical protein